MPTQEFSELLAKTTEAFRKSNLKGHSTTTFDDIQTKFEFADKRRQVINKICEDLADEIERALENTQDLTHIGFNDVRLEYRTSLDQDSIFIDCDIWEILEQQKLTGVKQ